MKPSAVIYSSRFSLAWSVSYAFAGVALLGVGAMLGKYLGEQAAAARSLDVAEWSQSGTSVATVFRKSSLLRGSFEDRLITGTVSARAKGQRRKDQERIAPGRVVISAPGKDVRHRSESLASIVPMSPEVEDFISNTSSVSPAATAKLPDRLVTDEEAGVTFDLPDGPMSSVSKEASPVSVPLPGEIVGLDDGNRGNRNETVIVPASYVVPVSYEEFSQSNVTRSPSLAKLSVMAARGSKERVRLVTRRKSQVVQQVCLAKAIYFEARSEPTLGQMAVAGVVMNRVRSKRYPNSICGVVFQNEERRDACQFSFACDGKTEVAKNKKLWRRSMQLAKAFITGKKKAVGIRNALHYHADYVNPKWASKMRKVKKIGRHIFYQRSTRVASN